MIKFIIYANVFYNYIARFVSLFKGSQTVLFDTNEGSVIVSFKNFTSVLHCAMSDLELIEEGGSYGVKIERMVSLLKELGETALLIEINNEGLTMKDGTNVYAFRVEPDISSANFTPIMYREDRIDTLKVRFGIDDFQSAMKLMSSVVGLSEAKFNGANIKFTETDVKVVCTNAHILYYKRIETFAYDEYELGGFLNKGLVFNKAVVDLGKKLDGAVTMLLNRCEDGRIQLALAGDYTFYITHIGEYEYPKYEGLLETFNLTKYDLPLTMLKKAMRGIDAGVSLSTLEFSQQGCKLLSYDNNGVLQAQINVHDIPQEPRSLKFRNDYLKTLIADYPKSQYLYTEGFHCVIGEEWESAVIMPIK